MAEPTTPRLAAIIRHLAASLLLATIIPSVLFYICLMVGDIWAALAAALAWCYGAMAWRMGTRRRCSGLLWLTAGGLTAKTVFSLATGNTFVYFLQPAVTDVAIAVVFLISLAGARPVVARLAGDFYPMTDDIAAHPRVQRLFWHLTLMWAMLCLVQAGVTAWLLETTSLSTFVAARTGVTTGIAVAGAAVTVAVAARIARSENLLFVRRAAPLPG
ncbi:MAG TPA: VC0807 family protein [Mycobacteriales bacterium]|jgi:uncharacterized membrane protein|nr:VC0807 family protein [Mycobacteriales bacterium]